MLVSIIWQTSVLLMKSLDKYYLSSQDFTVVNQERKIIFCWLNRAIWYFENNALPQNILQKGGIVEYYVISFTTFLFTS